MSLVSLPNSFVDMLYLTSPVSWLLCKCYEPHTAVCRNESACQLQGDCLLLSTEVKYSNPSLMERMAEIGPLPRCHGKKQDIYLKHIQRLSSRIVDGIRSNRIYQAIESEVLSGVLKYRTASVRCNFTPLSVCELITFTVLLCRRPGSSPLGPRLAH